MITITHTSAEGTLVDGTSRGDGTAEILKRNGFRWSRNLGQWFIQRSRDRAPDFWKIDRAEKALREAGFEVEVLIDTEVRDMADVEADRDARSAARAERLGAKAEKLEAASTARAEHVHRVLDVMAGTPILIGHHSEKRHRRDLDKLHDQMRKAVDEGDRAEELDRRAKVAASARDARHNPVTVGNRIQKKEAELRKMERALANPRRTEDSKARLQTQINYAANELNFWRDVRAEQIASGRAPDIGPHNVKAGDRVYVLYDWRKVVRANKQTVTTETDYSWHDKTEWHKVSGHWVDGEAVPRIDPNAPRVSAPTPEL